MDYEDVSLSAVIHFTVIQSFLTVTGSSTNEKGRTKKSGKRD